MHVCVCVCVYMYVCVCDYYHMYIHSKLCDHSDHWLGTQITFISKEHVKVQANTRRCQSAYSGTQLITNLSAMVSERVLCVCVCDGGDEDVLR